MGLSYTATRHRMWEGDLNVEIQNIVHFYAAHSFQYGL